MFWNVTGEICLYNFSSLEMLASKDAFWINEIAFSPDVDSKTCKNTEILQADGPSRDRPPVYPLSKTAQIHFDVLSNYFSLT